MAENKSVKNEQWFISNLLNKIKRGDITKPKFQRKKKWTLLPDPKNDKLPNEQAYIQFLFDTQDSGYPIIFGENGSSQYTNIDGNNRINTIFHFMDKPFEIFPNYLNDINTFIDSLKLDNPVKEKVKKLFSEISYENIIDFKYSRYFKNIGEAELYDSHLKILADDFEPYIENIQNKLKIKKGRFDTTIQISAKLYSGHSIDELAKIFESMNKYTSTITDIDLMASRLHSVINFEITDPIILTCIQQALIDFYRSKAEHEVLECYKFDKNDRINAYDLLVGFQNYCHEKCKFVEKTDSNATTLFFKLYRTLYKSVGTIENLFTTEFVNRFISQICECYDILNELEQTSFTTTLNEALFNIKCSERLSTLKMNNMYLIIISIIGYIENHTPRKKIIESIRLTLFYHFFIQCIEDKEKREEMSRLDYIGYQPGGQFIDKSAENVHRSPELISGKITIESMKEVLNLLLDEGNQSRDKKKGRRKRKFYEKVLIYFYYKQQIPINFLRDYTFELEHIAPYSSTWKGKIDIDRLGNIIPITTPLNRKRGTKPISYYKEEEPYKYIQYIEEMIPSVEMYDQIVSHAKHQQSIISNELYDKFCEENEKRYIDNFMICMFGKNL
jgi:hypothetical protein